MQTPDKQRGITLIGMLMAAVLIGFFGLLSIKLIPVYLSHFNVVESMNALKQVDQSNRRVTETGASNLKRRLVNQLSINGVTSVDTKNIEIKTEKKNYMVRVAYDAKVKLFGNVFALIEFDKTVMVPKRGS